MNVCTRLQRDGGCALDIRLSQFSLEDTKTKCHVKPAYMLQGLYISMIARGITRKKVFDGCADRDFFLERLGMNVQQRQTRCFAWELIPSHFHILPKTGATPIATVMKRLLTG